jgi:hypothetical protein
MYIFLGIVLTKRRMLVQFFMNSLFCKSNRSMVILPTDYVKSNTIVGDPNHIEGVVLAEIVKANIPVRNGVVHLIHRPLMVVDTTVKQFLEVSIPSSDFLSVPCLSASLGFIFCNKSQLQHAVSYISVEETGSLCLYTLKLQNISELSKN